MKKSKQQINYAPVPISKKRRYRNKVRKFIITFGVIVAVVLGGKSLGYVLWNQNSTVQSENATFREDKEQINLTVDLESLNSPYAILVDLDSESVVAKHNENVKVYPASLTKIMTAILAIEYTENRDEKITLSDDLFQKLYAENASMAGFQSNETVCFKDLIYGILLPSGAECCIAVAETISGSEDEFVKLMNQKADELGMKNTHFCNTTGLHDSRHYSTVRDLSILLEYALKNEFFLNVFTSDHYSTMPTNQHPEGITFSSTMFKYMDSPEVTGGEIIGGKTGYTSEAGLCLASLAVVNGKEYILVTAKAEGNHQTEQFHILDAINVYNQIGENKK